MENLSEIFQSILPGKNFMTPIVEGYFKRGTLICELSTGSSFLGLHGFGVTIVDSFTRKRCIELDQSFCDTNKETARKMAMDYIDSLEN